MKKKRRISEWSGLNYNEIIMVISFSENVK